MKKMGMMTKSFVSIYLAEGPVTINSRYTYSLPLYSIGMLFIELLESGCLHVNKKDEIEIINDQETNSLYVNKLMLCIQHNKTRTCKEWFHYFGEERKVVDEIFKAILKEMEEEGMVRYHSKKILSFFTFQTTVENVDGANSFVDDIRKDLLFKKGDEMEKILLLWKYYYASYIKEQERISLQKEQTFHHFVQQIKEGVLEGAQRNILFV